MQPLHVFNIQRLQSMSRRCDEVETCVDSRIWQRHSVDARLRVQERLVLTLDVVDDGLPAVRVVDGVAEPRRVHDGQREVHAALLQQDFIRVDLKDKSPRLETQFY